MIIQNTIKLEVKFIDDIKGFGVFSEEEIPQGSIVETCYSIKTYKGLVNPAYDYLFHLDEKSSFLPLGYGSIYNHSDTPNIHWRVSNVEHSIIEFFSLRKIEIGEELCHNYGKMYWKARGKKLL